MTVQDGARDLPVLTRAWQEWHSCPQTRLADPYRFLAIAGPHWLSDQPRRTGRAPDLPPTCRSPGTPPRHPTEGVRAGGAAK